MLTRMESDSIGMLEVSKEAYYGVQSLRAKHNFAITGRGMHPELIVSLAKVKKAAAITNRNCGVLDGTKASVIIKAAEEIIGGKLQDEFIIDAIQGGAGTSANMNANEVIANRAIELLGGTKGDYQLIHPNDHVNMGQSTNDVFPTAGKIAVTTLLPNTIAQLERLHLALLDKASEFHTVIKMGRTQLQDAVPMRLGQSFHAFASAIKRDISRLKQAEKSMHIINMGGTAIGTAINVNPAYFLNIAHNISLVCKDDFIQAEDLFDATQNLDGFVEVSAALKTCAVNISKICNDLRLLSSGPKAGLSEIYLPAMQNGSSIMPGKVNPVIPEVVTQIAFNIIGNDITISMAAEAGQMELNAFEPVLFYKLFESIETLGAGVATLVDHCICGIKANESRCKELLYASVGIATALCPYIGYKKSADIAKESLKTGIPVRKIVLQKGLLKEDVLDALLDPALLTQPQINETDILQEVAI